jgi:hypothetical protein
MSKLNLSKFKKVSSDADFTTMQHPAGHTIKIAHKPLSAQMRAELDGIQPAPEPQKFAKGGYSHIHTQTTPNFSKNIPHLNQGTPPDGKVKAPVVNPQGAAEFEKGYPWAQPAPAKVGKTMDTSGDLPDPEDAAEYGQQVTAENARKAAAQQPQVQAQQPQVQAQQPQVQAQQPQVQAQQPQAHPGDWNAPSYAKGGKVCPTCGGDPTQKHLLPGDSIPNKIEKQVVGQARKHFDGGGDTTPAGVTPSGWAAFQSGYPGSTPSPKPSQTPTNKAHGGAIARRHYADGTDNVSTAQEAYGPAAPTQFQDPEAVRAQQGLPSLTANPTVRAEQANYNNMVQSQLADPDRPDNPAAQQDIANAQFGPKGEPPANFRDDIWNQAHKAFGAQQAIETGQKQQAAQALVAKNNALIQSGQSPIPLTADQQAAANPPNPDDSQQPAQWPAADAGVAAQQQQQAPDTSQPGDEELKAIQDQNYQMPGTTPDGQQAQGAQTSSGMPTPPDEQPGATPQQTAQNLQAASQMTYDTFMQQRQATLDKMKDITPQTLGTIFENKELPGKLGMIAGLMLGGLSSGMTGKSNPVLDMYNQTINNELKAQTLNLGKNENLLANNLAMTGNVKDAQNLFKVNAMDYQMHLLTQLAQKYPNNTHIQQNLQTLGMMGQQSSANLFDSVKASQTWRHSVSEIQDPLQRIQFNPMLTPQQKDTAIKEYGTYQNMNATKTNLLNAFDQVSKMSLAERMTPAGAAKVDALIDPVLASATKDTEGRITPQDVQMLSAAVKPSKIPGFMGGEKVKAIQRQQIAKIFSAKMNFPNLSLAGVNVQGPPIGGIPESAPNRPRQ